MFFFLTYFVSCNGPCAPKEKRHRNNTLLLLLYDTAWLYYTVLHSTVNYNNDEKKSPFNKFVRTRLTTPKKNLHQSRHQATGHPRRLGLTRRNQAWSIPTTLWRHPYSRGVKGVLVVVDVDEGKGGGKWGEEGDGRVIIGERYI